MDNTRAVMEMKIAEQRQRIVEMQDTVRTDLKTSHVKEKWAQDRTKRNRLQNPPR